ncbi:MAG: hypothetical protein Q8K18_15930 [Burkholderiales bacterium]|nr:hypothetical protein [Burkholderiales bacterium]
MTANRTRIGLGVWAALQRQRRACARPAVAILAKAFFVSLLACSLLPRLATSAQDAEHSSNPLSALFSPQAQPVGTGSLKRANFERERASAEARHVADWVIDSGDNRSMPFAIVDKTDAKVFVFDAKGRLRGAAPALLGLALGDDAVPGIGDRPLSSIRPEERTTPAGRFEAALDRNLRGKEILWVDYDGAVSMHPVVTTKPEERRAQRLATPTPLDNRISYGCINVPAKFFETVVRTAFTGTNGIVYVLPETRTAREVFASYDVEERARRQTASHTVPVQVASGADPH